MRSPRVLALLASLLALALAACSGGSGGPQCTDGLDNDADGLIDDADPSCASGGDTEDADDPVRDCNDDADNDSDGLIDFPEDPGCTDGQDNSELNSPVPECDDGTDNDDDGLVDYPDDPGCSSPLQNTEDDDCPSGPNCPECGNGVDDDDDTATDYPADSGCTAASDDAERTADPTACAELAFEQLPQSGLVAGVLTAGASVISSTGCGGAGPEKAYEMYIEAPVVMVATTDLTGTAFDTVLYVRERCGDMSTELGCNDDAATDTMRSTLTVALEPGFYYLIVDAGSATAVGGFQLQVTFFPGLGTDCTPGPDACAPGLVCRVVPPASGATCELPVCNDGRDDDGDLLTDYPNDPGCASQGDDDETDDCQTTGLTCPDCGNGVDDDGDLAIDYPADPDCASAGQVVEGCSDEQDPIVEITDDTFVGNTTGYHDDSYSGSCGSTGGFDAVHFLTVPVGLQSLVIDTNDSTGVSDSVLYMDDASCDGVYLPDNSSPFVCDDDGGSPGFQSMQTFGALPAGTYAITVDGYSSSNVGAYNLHVHGVAVPSAACTDPLFAAGVLACPTDYPCDGAVCAPPDCGNTVDDDGDGKVGYPTDPGCTSILDPDESDNCPNGAGCPLCGNAIDDDGDLDIDYPDDINCSAASSNTESCTDTDPIGQITGPVTTGSTVGLTGNFSATCATSGSAPDKVYLLDLPALTTTLTIDTIGSSFDTVLMLKSAACEAADIACDDESGGGTFGTSKITRTDQPAGGYAIVVDGWSTGAGDYILNVHGTVAAGAACNSPLFPSGALTCAAGEFCNGLVCTPAACNDAVDGDIVPDGKVGYPSDPGCSDISDNDEYDDCPSGPTCPRCSNTLDDDLDGLTNYPNDPSCPAASTDDESGCASATDPYVEITGPTTTGNLDTEGNDLEPTCVTAGSSGRDSAFELNLPYPVQSLYLDTNGSSVNTMLAIRANGCTPATDLGCDNNSGDDLLDSYIALGATAAGRYAVVVDSTSGSTGTFALHVRGVIAQGGACSPALETSGLFPCVATSHCAGALGAETCIPYACSNGGDDDADGKADALDPGCLSGADDTEADPGAAPQCANTSDDDLDGQTDYPTDLGCKRASDPLELTCAETTGVVELTAAHVTDTTVGAGDNFLPGCAATSAAPEKVYSVTVPGLMTSLTFDVSLPVASGSYNRVLFVRRDGCTTDVACSDSPESVTMTNAIPGTYFVFVDGAGTAAGTYQLGVRGTIASGQACDPVQVQAGMFSCAAGTACLGNVCQ